MNFLILFKDRRTPGFKRCFPTALLALALTLSQNGFSATEQNKSSNAILFQGFDWNSAQGTWYANIQSKATAIKDLGVTHVWFPPPSNSAAREGYLPRELNNLDTAYGSEAQLVAAIRSLRNLGIESVADIVINHRVGNTNFGDFRNPTWGCSAVANNDEWPGRCGGDDSGTSYGPARDIDHSQVFVQNDIKAWMSQRLRGVGFSGWRYDFSKGYAASYAKLYNDASQPNFCVGEIWPDFFLNNVDGHRQALVDYVNGTGGQCAAFDFTSKALLNKVLRDNDYWRLRDSAGRPAGGIGWWPQKMVSFVDNHDTGPSTSCAGGQNMWPVPCDKVMTGYAYILTHPGIPTIYYPHVFDWGLRPNIKALVSARQAAGVSSTSPVTIVRAEQGLYAALVDGSEGRVAMKLGSNDWNPGVGWNLAASGNDYAVWTQLIRTEPPSSCVNRVSFSIAAANTEWGDSVFVVGNLPAMGQWNPARGLPLSIQGTGAQAAWTGSFELPANASIQYKYMKWNGVRAAWEANSITASGNRQFSTTAVCGDTLQNDDGTFIQP